MQYSTSYIFAFATALCLVCSTMISVSAVALRERQAFNDEINRKKNVLEAAGLKRSTETLSDDEVLARFESVEEIVLELESNEVVEASAFVDEEVPAPDNDAQIKDVPVFVKLYHVVENGEVQSIVLPIYGNGLWSTLYGYIAIESDTNTVRGITYYQHGETPGLGGEVDNPRWKSLWNGRKVYDDEGNVELAVIKGAAGPPSEAPYEVDGLSGATITSRGVSNMIQFWLGPEGYGKYLEDFRQTRAA